MSSIGTIQARIQNLNGKDRLQLNIKGNERSIDLAKQGNRKGIRVYKGCQAWLAKLIGKAVDVEINGQNYTLNKKSWAHYNVRNCSSYTKNHPNRDTFEGLTQSNIRVTNIAAREIAKPNRASGLGFGLVDNARSYAKRLGIKLPTSQETSAPTQAAARHEPNPVSQTPIAPDPTAGSAKQVVVNAILVKVTKNKEKAKTLLAAVPNYLLTEGNQAVWIKYLNADLKYDFPIIQKRLEEKNKHRSHFVDLDESFQISSIFSPGVDYHDLDSFSSLTSQKSLDSLFEYLS